MTFIFRKYQLLLLTGFIFLLLLLEQWMNRQVFELRIIPEKKSILYGFLGFTSRLPRLQHQFDPEPIEFTKNRESKRRAIEKSFLHAWNGYKKFAWGHDELSPLSNKYKDSFGGWGATMIDSLSTLLIMDLNQEFYKVLPMLKKIDFNVNQDISVFESVIRYLAGLLSAYELTERKSEILLRKARQLANQVLLPAFNNPTGFPHHLYNPYKNKVDGNETLIAEVGTVQLEFMMLSQLVERPIYAQKAQIITDLLDQMGYEQGVYIKGLYPTRLDVQKGKFKDALVTFGAMGDSVFEYFLKEYLLMDGLIPQYGRMYLDSIQNMKKHMLRQIPGQNLLILPPYDSRLGINKQTMDHLTCFVPGMLAMGSVTFNEPEDMEIAKALLETCVYMYRTTTTGLSPETWLVTRTEPYNPFMFNKTQHENRTSYDINYQLPTVKPRPNELYLSDKKYALRPETVESLFILYRMTGDQKYQAYGWEIYQSIEKWCKTKSGYASIRNVDTSNLKEPNQIDSMETFLLAETFKYLYLLFSPPDFMSLDKFIFNTEGHPFIRRHWNWDRLLKTKKKM